MIKFYKFPKKNVLVVVDTFLGLCASLYFTPTEMKQDISVWWGDKDILSFETFRFTSVKALRGLYA